MVGFPLLLIPFAVYFILALMMPGLEWTTALADISMASGGVWHISLSDVLICLTLLLLFFELLKATRPAARSVVDHLLATLIFIGALIAFIMLPQAASSTFAILVMIAFIDVIGGWSISVRSAQRDVSIERVVE